MNPDDADNCCILTHGEVHAWHCTIDIKRDDIAAWTRLLSAEEREWAQRFRQQRDRLLFSARRGLLRQLISCYTGMDPVQVTYTINPYGKLSLPCSTLRFNLSHSRNRIVFAFASNMELGVDIEQVRPLPDIEVVCRHWFSEAEQQAFMNLPQSQRLDAFYHIWTQKEAFIKARGVGLSLPLQDFSVAADPNLPGGLISVKGEETTGWQMVSLTDEPGWQTALCVASSQPINVKWEAWTLPPNLSV